jgi:hypothetical protein
MFIFNQDEYGFNTMERLHIALESLSVLEYKL